MIELIVFIYLNVLKLFQQFLVELGQCVWCASVFESGHYLFFFVHDIRREITRHVASQLDRAWEDL